MTVYQVSTRRGYRGHEPGSSFEARLEPHAERRAVDRGDITVIERSTPQLRPGSYLLPRGWPTTIEEAVSHGER